MKTVAINGSSLTGNITGIERYMYEVLKRLDKLIDENELKLVLLCPEGVPMNIPEFERIECVSLKRKGNKVSMGAIRKFLKERRAVYCSLSGNLCLQKGAVICVHDIRTVVHKNFDPFKFRLRCRINILTISKWAGKMVTVSNTSKSEMCEYLNIEENRIDVIPNGWEHMLEVEEDTSIWERHPELVKGEYYYSMGSQAPHKNFQWVWESAKRHPENTYVVAGKIWAPGDTVESNLDNVIYMGYVSDEENKVLMTYCKAFLFPSRYEGFGIPPLEALACGAEIFVSNASCLPEIFEGAATFFSPDDYDISYEVSKSVSDEGKRRVLERYTWDAAAVKWYDLLRA